MKKIGFIDLFIDEWHANNYPKWFRKAPRAADIELFYDKNEDRFVIEMEKFIAALQGKGEVAATGEEGVIAMKLLDAIYKSSDLDQEVEV